MTNNGLIIKLQQFLECLLPVDKSRIGECKQCGSCCQLGVKCIFYKNNKCLIYKYRPLQCRKSPRTKKYLKEGCKGYEHLLDKIAEVEAKDGEII